MNRALEFSSVTVRYPGNPVDTVSGVSFCAGPGEKIALFGPNGSGKTTVLLAAAGLVPFAGSIFIDGTPVNKKNLQKTRDRTGFLFHIPEDQILFPRVLNDTAYGLIRRGVPQAEAHEKAMAALASLGAADLAWCSPFQLSHGQRQRVALAGALVTEPAVLLLDEPSSALDPRGRRSLAEVLRSLQSSMVIATHDVDFASLICDRYLIFCGNALQEGRDFREAERLLLGDGQGPAPVS